MFKAGDWRRRPFEISQFGLRPSVSVFHQWQTNLRILDVSEIKTVPYVSVSPLFTERLIGTIRHECLDRLFFWMASDLALKLTAFQEYNRYRTHSALNGRTPTETPASKGIEFKSCRWQKHCRGLHQTPIAA
jgi:hypothetical protein